MNTREGAHDIQMAHKFRRGRKFAYREIRDCPFISFEEAASKLERICIHCEGEILVKSGDRVKIGTPLSEKGGFTRHSSVSGIVNKVERGEVLIENDKKNEREAELPFGIKTGKTLNELDAELLIKTVASAGIIESDSDCKTHVLLEQSYKKAKTLVINAVCTEESDAVPVYLVTHFAEQITAAMKIIMSALGIKQGVIALSKRSREAYEKLMRITEQSDMIRCERLSDKYPQQNPYLIVYALSGMELSPLSSCADAGYLVLSALSCFDIYRLFAQGRSSCTDIVSVAKSGKETFLCELPKGVSADDLKMLFDLRGELTFSSPLCKLSINDLGFARLSRISEAFAPVIGTGVCSRCGECDALCPMYLVVSEFADGGMAPYEKNNAMICIECGLCEEYCPAHIPLLSRIRAEKASDIGR